MQGNQAFADTPRARHAWSCSDLSGYEPHKWHRVTLFALGCRQIITAVRLCDEGQLQRCSYLLPVSYWWMDRGCLACGASVQSSLRLCVWIYASLRSTLSSMRLGKEFDISCCFSSWTIGVDLNVSTCFSSYSSFSRDSRVHFLYNACTSRRVFFWVWGGRCVFWIYVKTR